MVLRGLLRLCALLREELPLAPVRFHWMAISVDRDAAEAVYVLEGTYVMHVEEHQELCGPGSFVYVPPNVVHTFVVVSEEPGKKLNLFSPAAMVGFFEALAEAEANGTATPERLAEISERNHMGIVGAVPDTYL